MLDTPTNSGSGATALTRFHQRTVKCVHPEGSAQQRPLPSGTASPPPNRPGRTRRIHPPVPRHTFPNGNGTDIGRRWRSPGIGCRIWPGTVAIITATGRWRRNRIPDIWKWTSIRYAGQHRRKSARGVKSPDSCTRTHTPPGNGVLGSPGLFRPREPCSVARRSRSPAPAGRFGNPGQIHIPPPPLGSRYRDSVGALSTEVFHVMASGRIGLGFRF